MSIFADPVTQAAFAVHENKGVFALLLGSGISRAAKILTGWEITLDLIRRVAEARGVNNVQDWAQWYMETENQEPDYSDLLEILASTPPERRSILDNYIEPNETEREENQKVPTRAHKAIAKLVRSGHIRVIITTNFDKLIENALHDEGIVPTIVHSIDSLKGAEPLVHASCYVFKIHGDYKDSRIRNTKSELCNYPSEYKKLLNQIFNEYGLIICGWSAKWDDGLRDAIQRAPNRRYSFFWASRRPLADKAKCLLDSRGNQATQIQIESADAFFTELQEQVRALEETRRQNSPSIRILLDQTKKYLATPEHRIQLSDLIERETERVIEFLKNDNKLKMDFSITINKLLPYTIACENASEGLVKVCGLIGRWGNDEHLLFVINSIRKLIDYANSLCLDKCGFTIKICKYPTLLMFQACLLSLVKAKKWSKLKDLLSQKIDNCNIEGQFAYQSLCPRYFWIGIGPQEYRSRFPGVLPCRLHDEIFRNWAQSFLPDMSSFTSDFILLETLTDLLLLENSDMVSIPGGLAEKLQFNSKILNLLDDPQLLSELTHSGFGDGDYNKLTYLINEYKRILRQRQNNELRPMRRFF